MSLGFSRRAACVATLVVAVLALFRRGAVLIIRTDAANAQIVVIHRVTLVEWWQRVGAALVRCRCWLETRNLVRLFLLASHDQLLSLLDHLLLLEKLDRLRKRLLCKPFSCIRVSLLEQDTHDAWWQNLDMCGLARTDTASCGTASLSELLELAEVAIAHDFLHVDGFHLRAFRRNVLLIELAISSQPRALHHDEEAVILEQVYVPAGQVLVVADLLVEHFPQVLVRFLVFVLDEPLRELVHEVGGHAHDFCLVHAFLHLAVVGSRIVGDVPLQVLVLTLHLHVVRGERRSCAVYLGVLPLSVLVAFFDLSLFKEDAVHHAVLVQKRLHFLRLHCEQSLQQ